MQNLEGKTSSLSVRCSIFNLRIEEKNEDLIATPVLMQLMLTNLTDFMQLTKDIPITLFCKDGACPVFESVAVAMWYVTSLQVILWRCGIS